MAWVLQTSEWIAGTTQDTIYGTGRTFCHNVGIVACPPFGLGGIIGGLVADFISSKILYFKPVGQWGCITNLKNPVNVLDLCIGFYYDAIPASDIHKLLMGSRLDAFKDVIIEKLIQSVKDILQRYKSELQKLIRKITGTIMIALGENVWLDMVNDYLQPPEDHENLSDGVYKVSTNIVDQHISNFLPGAGLIGWATGGASDHITRSICDATGVTKPKPKSLQILPTTDDITHAISRLIIKALETVAALDLKSIRRMQKLKGAKSARANGK